MFLSTVEYLASRYDMSSVKSCTSSYYLTEQANIPNSYVNRNGVASVVFVRPVTRDTSRTKAAIYLGGEPPRIIEIHTWRLGKGARSLDIPVASKRSESAKQVQALSTMLDEI